MIKTYEYPYMEINNGRLRKFVADEDGIVIIPDGVEAIEEGVFSSNGLDESVISDYFCKYYRDIDEYGQYIYELYIPASVKEIGDGAFGSYIPKIGVADNSEYFEVRDDMLFGKKDGRAICRTAKHLGKDTVPYGTKVLDKYLFMSGRWDTFTIPDGIERIGDLTFAYLEAKKLIIPASVRSVCINTFTGSVFDEVEIADGCTALVKTEFGIFSPDMTKLYLAFKNEDGRYVVPTSVTEMSGRPFPQDLKEAVLPKGIRMHTRALDLEFFYSNGEKITYVE